MMNASPSPEVLIRAIFSEKFWQLHVLFMATQGRLFYDHTKESLVLYEVNVTIYMEADNPEQAERYVETALDNCVSSGEINGYDLEQPAEE